MGDLKCSQADQTQCTLVSLSKDSRTGDFTARYGLPTAITGRNRRLLEAQRRTLKGAAPEKEPIRNPVVCMPEGSALLFENLSPKNYPVYNKESLINTNPTFDFSKFVLLAETLNNQTKDTKNNVTRFVFTFD